ncbi:GNAT family N-acetyltransferase [Oceanirhabdus seepicola]|uniref:GNAT family N-acetyltransferase n=1 Tax=Oceanirhabdus seepicola TaxID=2828781 RepID=A0A9J6NYY3_9CLOT|nr:GNAT family N-acetyltransferase [Oceanirhabdus seepicola]MCM1989190.1 GNAT family N-acetyltransferase [Oceanirhabdus seepicola]
MNYDFRKVNIKDVEDILTWKYEGIYSLYDNDRTQGKINWIKSLPEDENAFSVCNDKNELVAHFEIYIKEKINFAVQMRPSLTGKGMGRELIQSFLDFAKIKYNLESIELFVVKFNERAIKAYENVGFEKVKEYSAKLSISDTEETEFVVMEKYF